MPSIVSDVSAMFVLTTILRLGGSPGLAAGAGRKIRCCKFGGNEEYKGKTTASPRPRIEERNKKGQKLDSRQQRDFCGGKRKTHRLPIYHIRI